MINLIVSRSKLLTSHTEEPTLCKLTHEEQWIDGVYTPMLPAQEIMRLSRRLELLQE